MDESRDVEGINQLIAAFFAAFDNRDGREPVLGEMIGCFAEKAVIARQDGSQTELYTAMEFAAPRIELLSSGALVNFHEVEVSATTNIHGNIASRTSRYRKAGLLNGSPYVGAGTKLFQLVALESGWRILSLAWFDDDA